jgi:hypothetical protein
MAEASIAFEAASQVAQALKNGMRCRIGEDGKPLRVGLRDPTDYLIAAMDALMKLHGGPIELVPPVRPSVPPLYLDKDGTAVFDGRTSHD